MAYSHLSLGIVVTLALTWQVVPATVAARPPRAASQAATARASSVAVICNLRLLGHGSRPGLQSASLWCKGGSIAAAADPQLMQALGSGSVEGVVWSQDWACRRPIKEDNCLLVVCGGDVAAFFSSKITSIKAAAHDGGSALCITGNSSITLVNSTFADCSMRPVYVHGNKASVHIRNCTFLRNDMGSAASTSERYGGALAVRHGTARIWSSTFAGNKATDCGAVYIEGGALDINYPSQGGRPSLFVDNLATAHEGSGGHLCGNSHALVRIHHSEILGGSAHYGGALSFTTGVNVTIVASRVANATGRYIGCIDVDGGSSVVIRDSVIQGCSCSEPSCDAGGIQVSATSRLSLLNTALVGNAAGAPGGLGGGLHATDAALVDLQTVTFANNTAGAGGGLALNTNASMVLRGMVHFDHNEASAYGGGLLLMAGTKFSARDVASFVVAINNRAPRGENLFTAAQHIAVVSTDGDVDRFVASVDRGGGVLSVVLNVTGAQGLASDDAVQVVLLDSHNKTVLTHVAEGSPGQALRQVPLKLQQPAGSYSLRFGVLGHKAPPAELQLQIIPCPLGFITTESSCSWCIKGYFTFSPSDSECTMCVPNAQCPGGAAVLPAAGFWTSAARSIQMHRCMTPDACPGGSASSNRTTTASTGSADYKAAQCSEGYAGNLCGNCKPGYGRARAFVCRRCMSATAIILLHVGGILVMVGLVLLLVHFSTTYNITRRGPQQPLPAELLKVLVLHSQWLFIMSSLVGIPWPATVSYPLQAVGYIWSSTLGFSIGYECILPQTSAMPVAVQKALICLFSPVAVLFLVVVAKTLWYHCQPHGTTTAGHQFGSAVVCTVFLFLPAWVSTTFSLFSCVQLDHEVSAPYQADAVDSYWAEDMNQQCYTGYHRGCSLCLGIPLVLLLCGLLPAGVFVFVWHSRKQGRFSEAMFDRHYGFIYRYWREEVCWWESVLALQTMSLVMVSAFGFVMGSYYQVLVTLAVLGLVLMLLLWVRPFKCNAVNSAAVQGTCVLLATAYIALTFLPYNSVQPAHGYSNTMGVVLVLANLIS